MLHLDIVRVLELREIQDPLRFLVKAGFNYHTANRLIKNQITKLSKEHLEQLCLLLMCTPDDFYNWTPDKSVRNATKQPLYKLSGRKRVGSIMPQIHALSQDKLHELRKYIDKLSEDE
jgi:hypothetical protein